MTSFDEVVIMLHKFDSNSEHTFFTLHIISGFLLKIVSGLQQAPHFERAPHICTFASATDLLIVY